MFGRDMLYEKYLEFVYYNLKYLGLFGGLEKIILCCVKRGKICFELNKS